MFSLITGKHIQLVPLLSHSFVDIYHWLKPVPLTGLLLTGAQLNSFSCLKIPTILKAH